MPAPFLQILFKAEDALAVRLGTITGSLMGATIHKGGSSDDLALPYLAIMAEQAEDRQPRGVGNFGVRAVVEIHTSADDMGRAQRIAIAGAVGDLFWDDALPTLLSGDVAGFRVHGVLQENQAQRVEGRRHVYSMEMLLICSPEDV